ncbi:MAG: GWxTD domain-containing protein [Candidatus Aminicenantales bacterium]
MKKMVLPAIFILLTVLPFYSQNGLSPRYREWLEDVSPIITKTEREVFGRLRTDADRDKFIRFFWRQRDPYPDTTENEFYKEYMERIRFADQNFGRESSKRGSQTERGYFYLLLGKPLERQFFTTFSQVWPVELWYYQGAIEYGLPAYFYLIFYQPQGLGEYRLYSPGVEGPEALVVPSMTARVLTRDRAYQVLKDVSSELAGASLSYLPGEQRLQAGAFSSTSILASVRALPEKQYSDAYARNYLSYKDYVETEYTDNFIDSSFTAKVFRHGGQPYVHWALEPKKINFVDRGGRYQASFELVLRLEDGEGNPIFEKVEEIPLTVTPDQYKAHERQVFAFQDILPVIPGRFRLFGLLKNKSAQDFTSFGAVIAVPEEEAGIRPGPLVLYHNRERLGERWPQALRAFTFGGTHYLVNARNEFPPRAEMGVYLQLYGTGEMGFPEGSTVLLDIKAADAEAAVFSQKKALTEVITEDREGLDTGPVSLADLKPGYYSAELSLFEESGRKILTAKENFILLSQAVPVLPWVYAKGNPAFPNPQDLAALATEYFLTRQYDKALTLAERTLKLKDDPAARLLLGKILYSLDRHQDSLAVLKPLETTGLSRDAAKVLAADYAALKDWSAALVYLEKLLAEATELSVLNLAGECHLNLGRPDQALSLFQKSLEIDPNQPAVKALAEKAREAVKQPPRL